MTHEEQAYNRVVAQTQHLMLGFQRGQEIMRRMHRLIHKGRSKWQSGDEGEWKELEKQARILAKEFKGATS